MVILKEFIYVENPDNDKIISMFKEYLAEFEEINSIDLIKIANLCKGFTYNDVIAVCKFVMQNSSKDILGISIRIVIILILIMIIIILIILLFIVIH